MSNGDPSVFPTRILRLVDAYISERAILVYEALQSEADSHTAGAIISLAETTIVAILELTRDHTATLPILVHSERAQARAGMVQRELPRTSTVQHELPGGSTAAGAASLGDAVREYDPEDDSAHDREVNRIRNDQQRFLRDHGASS